MKRLRPPGKSPARRRELFLGQGAAFLASQVGAQSSRAWNRRLQSAGLDSRHVMLFWNVALEEGRSQRELAEALRLPGSRIVELIDALEANGWLERRTNAKDRRAREVYLTARGSRLLDRIMAIAEDHEKEFTKGLRPEERKALLQLLRKISVAQGLVATVHPDF
jgi:DNA-binding MarR family transcriptional regulator